jgi:nucleotide-binding universal stress UspA family protein
MVKLQRIVVPVDFSRRAAEAVEYASAMARHYAAEVTLLHVVEPPRFEFAMLEPPERLLERMIAERIDRVSGELNALVTGRLEGLNAKTEVLQGEPAESIVAYCETRGCDLIVMPTRGRSPFRHFILGSVSAKVLHDVSCAVVTGIHLDREFGFPSFRVGRVLAAVDLGPRSGTVLKWAAAIAGDFHADLHVVHVLPGSSPDAYRSNGLAHTSHARTALEELISLSGLTSVHTVIRSGEPHKEVSQAAGGLSADLVVIGRGTSGGVMGRLRAQSYGIVREAPCPVLSV